MCTESAGEQAVAVGDVDFVTGAAASGLNRTRNQVGPIGDVVRGIADDCWFSGGPAGGVQSRNAILRNRKQPVGIVVAEVLLFQERKFAQILQAAQIIRVYAVRAEAASIVLDVVVGMTQRPFEPLELNCAQFILTGALQAHGSPAISRRRAFFTATSSTSQKAATTAAVNLATGRDAGTA